MTRRFWFEVSYLAFAPFTLALLIQFAVLAYLERRFPRPIVAVLAVPFVVQDVLYNAVAGSVMFAERPREWLFTTRLKRLSGRPEVWRFAAMLNELDEGHV